jgi:hypothetical protein
MINKFIDTFVAAAFRLRQSTQAEACGYKIPTFTEGLHTLAFYH